MLQSVETEPRTRMQERTRSGVSNSEPSSCDGCSSRTRNPPGRHTEPQRGWLLGGFFNRRRKISTGLLAATR
jgi:hypothetical protein